jgi:hypothetical protein
MIEHRYRLKDYIITEYDNHFYTWEMNVVLGEHRTGSCFVIGDILVLHSFATDKNGCLKLEYSEKLARLPVWSKTRYYCFSDSLKDVRNGKIFSKCLEQATVEKYCQNLKAPVKKGEYHLGLYKIVAGSDQNIFWEKYDGINKITKGICIIISGLLFIQSKDSSQDCIHSRKEWHRMLKSLPKWETTPAWGRLEVLKNCNEGREIKKKFGPNLLKGLNMIPPSTDPLYRSNRYSGKKESRFGLVKNASEKVTRFVDYLFDKREWWDKIAPKLKVVFGITFDFIIVCLKKSSHGVDKIREFIRKRF